MTPNDRAALHLLNIGRLTVDKNGAVWRDHSRAEELNRSTGYGMVRVQTNPRKSAMAHRVVWLAFHDVIPAGIEINHRNGLRWDNRPENLELVTSSGNQLHRRGHKYDSVAHDYVPVEPVITEPAGDEDDTDSVSIYRGGVVVRRERQKDFILD